MANKTADQILEDYAKWTIKNVEHGIYIPLPSPEASRQLFEATMEIIGEDDKAYEVPDGQYVQKRNQLRAELRAKARAFYGIPETEGEAE